MNQNKLNAYYKAGIRFNDLEDNSEWVDISFLSRKEGEDLHERIDKWMAYSKKGLFIVDNPIETPQQYVQRRLENLHNVRESKFVKEFEERHPLLLILFSDDMSNIGIRLINRKTKTEVFSIKMYNEVWEDVIAVLKLWERDRSFYPIISQ